ncbi:heat shock factor protein 1 [Genypterus blacodes]|uniref:heat shock factor protein 1 n=1 Tax=Genypterus blacodes TaxID=154954 RepID=UPI003F76F08D
MELTGGTAAAAAGGAALSGGNVPAFLTKLWTLVEDPETNPLICWSPSGTSFHVFDQARFSKEVLPKFFKHNNMASFIRQLNMYGFRKVVHIEHGGLLKPERDDTEFQHHFFIRGQEHLLENIKRKVTNVSTVRQEDVKVSAEEVNKILNDVQVMKEKQETMDSKIIAMGHENKTLWRELVSLRQRHAQQQKVVKKLIQFLVSLVQSNKFLGVKRKIPLMLNDSNSAHSMPKYSRPLTLEHMQPSSAFSAAASLFSTDSLVTSGPIISDITEMATPTSQDVTSDWMVAGDIQSIGVKEESSSPDVDLCPVLEGGATPVDTPLSPTTFINSILQENETHPAPNTTINNPVPVIAVSHTSAGPLPPFTDQSHPSLSTMNSPSSHARPPPSCQTVACIDRSELCDHIESIDSGLENLQNILNSQTFTFDALPIMEFFSSGPSGEFDLESLDTLLAAETPKMTDDNDDPDTGKQLVQYSATPITLAEPMGFGEDGAELPSLLDETEPYFTHEPPADDPTISLLESDL